MDGKTEVVLQGAENPCEAQPDFAAPRRAALADFFRPAAPVAQVAPE
jgi:hypothetical protein